MQVRRDLGESCKLPRALPAGLRQAGAGSPCCQCRVFVRIRRTHPAECSVRLLAAAPWLLRDRPAGDLGGNHRNPGWLMSEGSTVACFSISVLVCAESAKCVEICPDKMLTWNGGATRMARSLLKSAGLHLCVCASVLGRGQDGQTQGTGR